MYKFKSYKNVKKKNYFKLFLLAVLMQFSIIVSAQFSGGNGLQGNPFKIESVNDWIALSENVRQGTTYAGVYFQMQNDIDFTGFYNFVILSFAMLGLAKLRFIGGSGSRSRQA